MGKINKRQIGYGGNFATLFDRASKAVVKSLPFVSTQVLTASAAQFKLIDSAILPGNISLGTTSVYSGGVVAAALAGAVGTAATTKIVDSLGNVANLVQLRDSTTKDPIVYLTSEVFGLIQAASTVADGEAIGATASENIQISFVYIAANGNLTLCPVSATVEFQVRKMFTDENLPAYEVESGSAAPDIVTPSALTAKVAKFVVTTAFAANEVITLTTGAGAASGAATPSGDYATVALGASANAFRDNNNIEVIENGVEQVKSADFIWDSTTTGHFIVALDADDTFNIKFVA
jgi:hypothetical protein